jgi:hypothetical protein
LLEIRNKPYTTTLAASSQKKMENTPEQLQLFYDSLENIKSFSIWNILREIKVLDKTDKSWEQKILTERKVFSYNINKGKITSNTQTTDIKGKVIQILLSPSEIEYIKERINITKNTWLLSRYSHLIWQETRHNDYAKIALENYYLSINKITAEEIRELAICLSAILYISKKTKNNIDDSKELAIKMITDFPNWYKSNLLLVILEDNYLNKDQLLLLANNVPNWISFNTGIDYFQNKQILDLSIKLYKKVDKPLEKIYELLAKNEDSVIQQHPLDTDFVKYTSTGEKAKYLALANKNLEAEECFKEYNRLKQTIKLGKFSTELDDNQSKVFNEYLNIETENLLQLTTNEILSFFSSNEEILVNPNVIISNSKENLKNSSLNFLNVSGFDINSNFKNLDDTDKINKEINQNYNLTHSIKCESLFLTVIVEGVIRGKINYYKIYEYLENNSWFGEKFNRSMTSRTLDENSSWLTMLAPGIHHLFTQFELSIIMSTNKVNNFILAIDSLTLKFEGLLRDFIRLCGGNTSTSKRGEIKEQLLEELLENPIIKKYFSIKDIELFKRTFTNKGKNIRNDIAHSFYQYSDYTMQKAMLIFFCILRLSRYKTSEKKQPTANTV